MRLSIPPTDPISLSTRSSESRTWTCLTSSRLRSCSTSRWLEWTLLSVTRASPQTWSGGRCCWLGPWATPASWPRPLASSPREPSPPSGWWTSSKLWRRHKFRWLWTTIFFQFCRVWRFRVWRTESIQKYGQRAHRDNYDEEEVFSVLSQTHSVKRRKEG